MKIYFPKARACLIALIFLTLKTGWGATINTLSVDSTAATFGNAVSLGTPLYGWIFIVPVASTQLTTVQYSIDGESSLSYTANLCVFASNACTGAPLWSSGTLTGNGLGLTPVTVSPGLLVTSGQQLLFYLFASTGTMGTGELGMNSVSSSTDNVFVFQNNTNPQSLWITISLFPGRVAAVETFTGGSSSGGGTDGETTVPEPSTLCLIAVGLFGAVVLKKKP